ncbi:MAG: hypothetical protein WD021_01305, partial [Rhodothermales bacterium]
MSRRSRRSSSAGTRRARAGRAAVLPADLLLPAGLLLPACFLLLAGLLLLVPGCSPAGERIETGTDHAPAPTFELIDRAGGQAGRTEAVDVDGTWAAFGRGSDVVLADVSDPTVPREVIAVTLPGRVRDVKLAGGRVFAAADSAGLYVVDVDAGEVVAALRFDEPVYGVHVQGDLAYVAARSAGLRVVDASATSSPPSLQEVGHLITPDEAVDVVVRGDFAYVAAWYESFRVIDVSDPTEPVGVSFAGYDSYNHGAVWGIAVDGDLGLAAIPEKGIRVIDVSVPRDVTNHAMYRGFASPAAAALDGRTAFVADQDAGLRVLDLTDPQQPVEIGSIDLPGRVLDVDVADGIAYVAAGAAGLRLVDVSTPNAPRLLGALDAGDAIVDVVGVGETLLAVGSENAVYRYDGGGRLTRHIDGPARRMAQNGGRVVTASDTDVRLFDEGRLRSRLSGAAHGVDLHGPPGSERMAVAGPLGLQLLDVASNGTLRRQSAYKPDWKESVGHLSRTPPAAWDVVLTDRVAYAAFDDGIHVLDVMDASAPTATRVYTPERVYRLLVGAGDRLFAACDDGLRIYDVSDPMRPVETAFVKTPSFATALHSDGSDVFVGDLSGYVTVVRAEDGARRGSWHVADRIFGLAAAGGDLAVATGPQGLHVVSLEDPGDPTE